MNIQLESLKATRKMVLNLTNNLTAEQLNKIPPGFKNNIIWNMAHLVSSQQGVCYRRSGLPLVVDPKYVVPYMPDTKPEKFIDENEIVTIKELLLSTIDKFEEDYNNNLFSNYTTWTTRYGVELKTIGNALSFLPFHEGLHVGYIMAQMKMVV